MSVLKNFRMVQLLNTRTEAVVTFYANGLIKLNNPACADLGYAPYLEMFFDDKQKQFAILAKTQESENTVKFSKPAGEQKYPVKFTCPSAVNAVKKMMGWDMENGMNVPGVLFADERVIIFPLEKGYPPMPKTGGRKKASAGEQPE